MIKTDKKKKAFTLAEVLITLGIIGLIAAMTLPTLLSNINNSVYATRIRQVHAQLYTALSVYMANNDLAVIKPSIMPLYTESTTDISVSSFFKQSFNGVIACYSPSPVCFADKYTVNKSIVTTNSFNKFWMTNSSYLLRNGSSISIIPLTGQKERFRVVIDVNNSRNPNLIGRDLWTLYIENDGTLSTASGRGTCETDYDTCLHNLQNNNWKPDF